MPDEGEYDVHGFAARDTPAGAAAFQQMQAFVESALAGDPVITFPEACAQDNEAGDCDYSDAWAVDGDPWGR